MAVVDYQLRGFYAAGCRLAVWFISIICQRAKEMSKFALIIANKHDVIKNEVTLNVREGISLFTCPDQLTALVKIMVVFAQFVCKVCNIPLKSVNDDRKMRSEAFDSDCSILTTEHA